jgi:hypothetical protein
MQNPRNYVNAVQKYKLPNKNARFFKEKFIPLQQIPEKGVI